MLLAAVLSALALWLLDTRQPSPWPESASAWWGQVEAASPGAFLVDWLNARMALTPDLPLGSVAVLIALAVAGTAAALASGAPATLACASGLGLVAMRSLASTSTTGRDAVAPLLVAFVVLATARVRQTAWPAATVALVGVAVEPSIALAVVPAVMCASGRHAGRRGLALALALVVALVAIVTQALTARAAWARAACLDAGSWWHVAQDVLVPGASADASMTLALRQTFSIVAGDVHLFGLVVASIGLVAVTSAAAGRRRLRRATLVTATTIMVGVGTGLLPPAFAAMLLLPWWMPWSALGFARLVEGAGADTWRRGAALVSAAALAALLPIARHVVYVPGPLADGTPQAWAALSARLQGDAIVSDDPTLVRQLAARGVQTLPADASAMTACLASGRRVRAIGSAVQRAEMSGFAVVDRPLQVPLAAVLGDVRPGQLVALALAPAMLAWTAAADRTALQRIGLSRESLQARDAVAALAVTDGAARVRAGRSGATLSLRTGETIGRYQLRYPVTLGAEPDRSHVTEAPRELASGASGALVIYDRGQAPLLRAVVDAASGLPLPVLTLGAGRHADVLAPPTCAPMSATWGTLPFEASRVSVPLGNAGRQPLLLYLATSMPPHPGLQGLTQHLTFPIWTIDVFDQSDPAQARALAQAFARDEVPVDRRPMTRWVTRVDVHPRDVLARGRITVSAGTRASSMLVRLAGRGRRAVTTAVCRMTTPGPPLLALSELRIDDETARAVPVAAAEGWHEQERVGGQPYRWSAEPSAVASFTLVSPRALFLAMDAIGAAADGVAQPLTVRVNDVVLSGQWPGTQRVAIPAAATRAGRNDLVLEVPRTVQPPGDARRLGVLVRQLRIIEPDV